MKSEPDRKSQNPTLEGVAPAPVSTRIDVAWSRASKALLASYNPTLSLRALNRAARRSVNETLRLSRFSLAATSIPPTANRVLEVALSFVDDDEMRALNAQYRGKNKPTDVLSFAQNEGETFPIFESDAALQLGDIIVSVETAQRQATERHHALVQEIEFLCVHGALHLLGYDHDTARNRKLMWSQQDIVMLSIGSLLLVSPSA